MRFRLQHHKQRNQAKNSTLIVGRFRRLVFSVRAAWENPSCGTGWITTARTKSGDVQNAKSRCQNRTMLLIYSPVFRLRGQHDPAMGRLNLARYRSLGQGKLPAPEGTVPAAGGIHRLGQQRRYAHQPPRSLPARCVQVRQSSESHPSHRETAPAHAGCGEDYGTRRTYFRPLRQQRHHGAGGCAGGIRCHRNRSVRDLFSFGSSANGTEIGAMTQSCFEPLRI